MATTVITLNNSDRDFAGSLPPTATGKHGMNLCELLPIVSEMSTTINLPVDTPVHNYNHIDIGESIEIEDVRAD